MYALFEAGWCLIDICIDRCSRLNIICIRSENLVSGQLYFWVCLVTVEKDLLALATRRCPHSTSFIPCTCTHSWGTCPESIILVWHHSPDLHLWGLYSCWATSCFSSNIVGKWQEPSYVSGQRSGWWCQINEPSSLGATVPPGLHASLPLPPDQAYTQLTHTQMHTQQLVLGWFILLKVLTLASSWAALCPRRPPEKKKLYLFVYLWDFIFCLQLREAHQREVHGRAGPTRLDETGERRAAVQWRGFRAAENSRQFWDTLRLSSGEVSISEKKF